MNSKDDHSINPIGAFILGFLVVALLTNDSLWPRIHRAVTTGDPEALTSKQEPNHEAVTIRDLPALLRELIAT